MVKCAAAFVIKFLPGNPVKSKKKNFDSKKFHPTISYFIYKTEYIFIFVSSPLQ